MEKIKKLEPNSKYMIITRATSKASFFTNTKQIKLFENLCETFLGGMCKIRKVLCVNKGYVMIMETQGRGSIERAYKKQRMKSKKTTHQNGTSEIWRMLSEHFRFMGCSFVKISNSRNGCEGTKFCRNYERYSLTEIEEEWIVKFIELGRILLDQKEPCFRLGSDEKRWYKVLDTGKEKDGVVYYKRFGNGVGDCLRI